MKKILLFSPMLLALLAVNSVPVKEFVPAKAESAPTSGSLPSKMNIDLNDSTSDEIRAYYSSLNSLNDEERQGTNILKNLKPILQNFTYYSYDTCWKIYEITDREWTLSPAEETTYGTYDSSTNTIKDYQFGTSTSNSRNNPYLHDLYKNRDEKGVTLEAGRLKAWDNHGSTGGGTDREHVWCQSRGFKASSGASGPAGTDVHHLMAGDSRTNQSLHNNNPYGYVDKNKSYTDGTKYLDYIAGNMLGAPVKTSEDDESTVVFEPQDCDKGDIARACFYMVACYNNLSGSDTITQFNPNLTLADYATSNGNSEASSATHAVAMGIMSDLLEWNRIDPVDEFEIHRNNLIYKNFQHNRNPFIDFPQWADYIWGDEIGTTIKPASDRINNSGLSISASELTIKPGSTYQISATVDGNAYVNWSLNKEGIVSIDKIATLSKEAVTITALSEGEVDLTASALVDGELVNKACHIVVSNDTPNNEETEGIPRLYIYIGLAVLAVIVIIVIIVIIAVPSSRKKAKKTVKKVAKKQIKQATKKKK